MSYWEMQNLTVILDCLNIHFIIGVHKKIMLEPLNAFFMVYLQARHNFLKHSNYN